ncbi:MAG: selenocysteine-specific translation elongation factor [Alphaproteobacteria bacterium]
MIVATAGHIDHGKTLLVRALTGIDTDRLPEEKRRGVSIDLGFAYVPLSDETVLGFVDVPGHERFIRNMLAGVTGIDFALLVVAADDGPMPQTEEHLAILDLLGVTRGAVALTKIDRVDTDRLASAREEVEILLHGSGLENTPVFPVSGLTGAGVPTLRAALERAAGEHVRSRAEGGFRLAVDRVFTLSGAGLVVTGTAFSGVVRPGDRLLLSPSGQEARVRTIHAQNRPAERGLAGERCALNLTGQGLHHSQVHRGDWVVDPALHAPTQRIDALIRVQKTEPRPLAHWTPVHVHMGAAGLTGRVAVLEGKSIPPGAEGLVQLVLDTPLSAVNGDRLVLRDQSAQRTVGGGGVVDVFPPLRGRAKPERIAFLRAMQPQSHAAALEALLAASPSGVALDRFQICRNLTAKEADDLYSRFTMVKLGRPEAPLGFAAERFAAIRQAVRDALQDWHRRHPDTPARAEAALRRELHLSPVVFEAALLDLIREGTVVREGMGVRAKSHRAAMAAGDMAVWNLVRERLEAVLEEGGLRPPRVREIAEETGIELRTLEGLLARAARLGLAHKVADNRYFLPINLLRLGEVAEAMAAEAPNGQFDAKDYRDRTDLGRTVTIEVLEYFDKAGLTRRTGEGRRVVKAAASVFAAD